MKDAKESAKLKIVKSQRGHYLAAENMQRKHFVVGMLTIIFATLASTLTFFENPTQIPAVDYIAPLLGITSAVLASIQTFSRFLERYDQHRISAVKYGALARRLEMISSPENIPAVLEEWERVSEVSPVTPKRFRGKAISEES